MFFLKMKRLALLLLHQDPFSFSEIINIKEVLLCTREMLSSHPFCAVVGDSKPQTLSGLTQVGETLVSFLLSQDRQLQV